MPTEYQKLLLLFEQLCPQVPDLVLDTSVFEDEFLVFVVPGTRVPLQLQPCDTHETHETHSSSAASVNSSVLCAIYIIRARQKAHIASGESYRRI